MIKLLRKIFIKNYNDTSDETVRLAHGKLSSIVGIICNIILAGIKLFAGIISGSIAVIADSINNLADMGSSIINLVGFKMSSKPADNDHPYGHERIEYIGGLIISVIILIVGGELAYNSISKLFNPSEIEIRLVVMIILGVSILVKLWMALFYANIGKKIDSISLKAAAVDSRNDCITTFAVLIGSIIYYYTDFVYIDGIIGVLVSILIIISGIGLVKEAASPLIGEGLDKTTLKAVTDDIKSYDICLGIHDVVCHLYGPNKTFMSVHVEVPASEDILYIHDQIDIIETEISHKYKIDLVIHMDPIENDNPLVMKLREEFSEALIKINSNLTLHDFRIVNRYTSKNIIFDCIKPRNIEISDDEITKKLYELTKQFGVFNLVINYEFGYVDMEEVHECIKD